MLDWREYVFINVDLTVHFERMPEGEWVCVDAVTRPQPTGIGTAESVLSDQRGASAERLSPSSSPSASPVRRLHQLVICWIDKLMQFAKLCGSAGGQEGLAAGGDDEGDRRR